MLHLVDIFLFLGNTNNYDFDMYGRDDGKLQSNIGY